MALGSLGVIHPRMLAAVSPTSTGAFTAVGALTRAGVGKGPYNDTTGRNDPVAPTALYDGAVKVEPQSASDGRVLNVGDKTISTRLYDAEVPLAWTDIREGDVLVLTACDDPYLVGRRLTVVDVTGSSLPTTRPLVVQDRLG